MSRTIMLIPTGTSVGLTSVSLGVIRAMERKGVRLSVFKPIAQPRSGGDAPDQTTTIVRASSSTTTAAEPLKMNHVESLLSSNQKDVLMEEIIANYHANTQDAEVVLVEGLVPTRKHQFAQALNFEIAKTLNAEIVFVMSQGTDTPEQLNERIELTRNSFGGAKNTSITGVIVNKLNAPVDEQGRTRPDLSGNLRRLVESESREDRPGSAAERQLPASTGRGAVELRSDRHPRDRHGASPECHHHQRRRYQHPPREIRDLLRAQHPTHAGALPCRLAAGHLGRSS